MKLLEHPLLRKYTGIVRRDLSSAYSRDLHKWLVVAPVVGVLTGLIVTLIAETILKWLWPPLLSGYVRHPFIMIPGLAFGFLIAGLLMQHLTPDPDEHSTEEIIRSYHERQGVVRMRPFVPKLIAAIATVGFGGSAALEGPGIYAGGAIGSWLWTKLRRFGLGPQDRRILLISGAAAGMGAVFRAPLTGIAFAMEMPYKDDLAHEALLPSLVASVVAYATLAFFLGTAPLFNFTGEASFSGRELLWAAVLGLVCGGIAMVFSIAFRRARRFVIRLRLPHWLKMAAGGLLTGICGWAFLAIFGGHLVPIGPNYEAVGQILQRAHGTFELIVFGAMKLVATLFSLGVGGVSAMFVPLFLTGGSFGAAFAQFTGQAHALDLYAAAGMAAFLAAGYKAPLTAVIFVAEAAGGHAYIIPALIAAAVAYAVSGETSVSDCQRLRETPKIVERWRMPVAGVMRCQVATVGSASTVQEFLDSLGAHPQHAAYPVLENNRAIGVVETTAANGIPAKERESTKVGQIARRNVPRVRRECELRQALRLLRGPRAHRMLLIVSGDGVFEGIVTKTDLLDAFAFGDSAADSRPVSRFAPDAKASDPIPPGTA